MIITNKTVLYVGMRRLISVHGIHGFSPSVRFTVFQFENRGSFNFFNGTFYSSVVCTQAMMAENPGFPMTFSFTSVGISDDQWLQPITVLDSAPHDIYMGYPRSTPVSIAWKELYRPPHNRNKKRPFTNQMGKFIVTDVSLGLYTVVEKRGFKQVLDVLEPKYETCNTGPTTLMSCQLIK